MNSKGTRRKFLSGTAKALGGAAWLSASAGTLALAGQADSRAADFGAALDLETFEPLVNTTFVVESEDKKREKLLLTRVQRMQVAQGANSKSSVRGPRLETFSLLFRQTGQGRLTQDTYQFFHPAIGKFEMFIVPVLRSDKVQRSQRYEAIFSRLV